MKWSDYCYETSEAVQKGATSALHALETGLAVYGTLKGGYQLATQIGGGLRAIAPVVGAAAVL